MTRFLDILLFKFSVLRKAQGILASGASKHVVREGCPYLGVTRPGAG